MKKIAYELKNLNCAHCATLIDNQLKKISKLENHSLNFVSRELKVEIEEDFFEDTIQKIKQTISKIENSVELIEKNVNEVKFRLENLFCQSCSIKIEKKILDLDKIKDGHYNFSTQILTLKVSSNINSNDLKNSIQNIVDSVEEGVTVKLLNPLENDSKRELPESQNKIELILNSIGTLLFIILIIFKDIPFRFPLFLISYFLISYNIVFSAFKNLKNKNALDENFLMTIATAGAFGLKEYPEAVSVMLFYKIGEFFQNKAVSKSRKSIESLLNIKPKWANVIINGVITRVKPEEVSIGEIVTVYPGESIPLDGIIIKGSSGLDTKALTGESLPVEVTVGTPVLNGSININSTIEIKVTKDYNNSTVSKILDLVENAAVKKAKTENFITIFSKYYTPFVVAFAIVVGLILPLFIGNFNLWFYRALIFLVISCPCALVVSIPLGYFGGIGRASRHGILIKGSNYLEALTKVNKIILDKTGTLTKGSFVIKEFYSTTTEDELFQTAIIGENDSNHPIAIAIKNSFSYEVNPKLIKDFEVLQGYGTKVNYNNELILVGNLKLMKLNNISVANNLENSTIVHVSKNNKYLGYILLNDDIKSEAALFIKEAGQMKINLLMLSGDNENICKEVANTLKIEKYYSSLLPNDKVNIVENELTGNKGTTIFVGDGINDSPVLKRVDIGISMGGIGSDAAIEASDIVIMDDKLNKILLSIIIAKKTKKIVIQNIIFALSVKTLILILGVLGHANMWEAIFADVGVALIAIFNSIRALRD